MLLAWKYPNSWSYTIRRDVTVGQWGQSMVVRPVVPTIAALQVRTDRGLKAAGHHVRRWVSHRWSGRGTCRRRRRIGREARTRPLWPGRRARRH